MSATWDEFERLQLAIGRIVEVQDLAGAVLGFEPKRIAGFKSEVLVLGALSERHGVVLLQPDREIEDGVVVA